MADLKKRLAPLEGIEMPDRWSEIQRRAPRAGFDPEPPRRQPIVAIALAIVLSIVTVGWLASAFRSEPQVVDEPTPTVADPSPPSPEPDPTVDPNRSHGSIRTQSISGSGSGSAGPSHSPGASRPARARRSGSGPGRTTRPCDASDRHITSRSRSTSGVIAKRRRGSIRSDGTGATSCAVSPAWSISTMTEPTRSCSSPRAGPSPRS